MLEQELFLKTSLLDMGAQMAMEDQKLTINFQEGAGPTDKSVLTFFFSIIPRQANTNFSTHGKH